MGPFGGASHRSKDFDSQESTSGLVSVLASVLQRLIEMNSGSPNLGPVITRAAMFNSSTCPPISVMAYLARIQKYANCSDSCFVVALIYVDRLIELRNIVLTSLNVHRIIITSILLATKSLDDVSFNNSYFAKLGGISSQEINLLECEFLCLVNYSLYVRPEAYDKYCMELKKFSSPMTVLYPFEEEKHLNSHHYPQVHFQQKILTPFNSAPLYDHSYFSVPLPMTNSSKTVEDEIYAQSYFSSGAPYSMVSQAVPNVNPSTVDNNLALFPSRVALMASYYSSNDCYATTGPYEKLAYSDHLNSILPSREYSAFDPQSYVFPFGMPRCCGKTMLECALR